MPENREFDLGEMNFEPIARRQLPMFFLVDTSGSMDGSKIGAINTTMKELLPELADLGEADSDIRVAVLTFSSGFEWITPTPQKPEEIVWRKLEADGVTDLGRACKELNSKMSRKEFLQSPSSTYAPIVILLTDGEPTDNYQEGFEVLWTNNWFKNALKFALPILPSGSNTNQKVIDILAEFTGNPEAVLKNVSSAAKLRKMLSAVSITSAAIGSRSSIHPEGDGDEAPGESSSAKLDAAIDEIKKIQDEPMTSDYSSGDDAGVDLTNVSYDDDETW